MKKTGWNIFLAAFVVLCVSGLTWAGDATTSAGPKLKGSAEFEGGKLYRAGKFSVVELTGDYRQMGRQYGGLLKNELQALYHLSIEEFFIKKQKLLPERIKTIAMAVFEPYPQRYKEILYGMAETSGLGLEKQILLNAIEWYPKINHLSYGRCSGVAAWGPYTSGDPLVFGRNNDDSEFYTDFARFMVVSVFKPNDRSISTALINYAGVIYNATGMNSEGLFIELNAGPWMGFSLERVSAFTTIFSFLQDYSTLAEVDRAFKSTLVNMSSIINVADPTRACSYECSLYDTRRRDQDRDGFIAATNHFVDPNWNISQVDDEKMGGLTIRRYRNLLALGEKYKGTFNPQIMMKVLDTPIEKDGPTVKGTIYQVIAVPAQLKIWLKAPGIQDWTEIELGMLFGKKGS